MSKRALAEACGVSPMSIAHYEAGDRRPGMDVLLAISEALDVTLADLLRRRSPLVFEHGDIHGGSVMGAAARELVRESVEEHLGRFHDVLECLGSDVLPAAPECGRLPLTLDADADALVLRRHLGVGPVGPVTDLVCLLEDRGILCVELREVDERFVGVGGFADGRPYVAVNARLSPERTRLVIVCEIARLMFEWEEMESREREAHVTAVAGAFLLPAADVVRELGVRRRAVTRDMEMVAREYGISMMLLSECARRAGIISDSACTALRTAATEAGWRKDESGRIAPERPELLRRLVCRAAREDDMSVCRGAELLGLDFDQVACECGLCGT